MSKEENIDFSTSVKKIIKNECPAARSVSSASVAAISICTKEFAKILVSQIAIECDKHGTVVNAGDVKAAVASLGYKHYTAAIENQDKIIKKKKESKPKPKEIDLSVDEQIALQKRLRKEAIEELKRRETLGY